MVIKFRVTKGENVHAEAVFVTDVETRLYSIHDINVKHWLGFGRCKIVTDKDTIELARQMAQAYAEYLWAMHNVEYLTDVRM